jgi:hypothetical protein
MVFEFWKARKEAREQTRQGVPVTPTTTTTAVNPPVTSTTAPKAE